MSSSGVDVDLGELIDRVYLPGRRGSLQVEMLAATRSSGRLPYLIDGTLRSIVAELDDGRPVVILQNLGVAAIPKWHFAVVVGIDTERSRIALRSGEEKRRITRISTFLRTWRRSDYWGFVVLRPDELPSGVDRQRYLKAAADLEKAGRSAEAATAWQTALTTWPGDRVALFGLGNARLAAGDNGAAERYFRALLERYPESVAARNNLAIALARQSRFADARGAIAAALDINDDPLLERELEDTAHLIEDLSRDRSSD